MGFRFGIVLALCCASALCAADVPQLRAEPPLARENSQPNYYWKVNDVGDTAQLLALFCRSCGTAAGLREDVPLVAVLRDTLGDDDTQNDRVTDVWLLTYSRPSVGQRILAAVPFFYWRVGRGSGKVDSNPAPLLDLNAPQHPMLQEASRDIVQWSLFDPMTTAVRATSRAYRANQADYERLHLEEAIDYLREAPVSDDGPALTRTQLNTVIARLELRKRLLGGLVTNRRVADIGQQDGFEEQRIRSRNWELLRECADRTGLFFEPLSLAGASDQYAILWFPLGGSFKLPSTSLAAAWKLLHIKNPWSDDRLKNWRGPVYERVLDSNGALLPSGSAGRQIALVPLAVYSLNYPRNPLLLIDFRGELRIRRHETTQRTINELTAGVIGISHFANWYYFVAADLYDFVAKRHGDAVDEATRLDCYSQFRVQLALDRRLDPKLRDELQRRLQRLAINPLDAAPERELEAAAKRYQRLVFASDDKGRVVARLDKQRRAEIAAFRESTGARARDTLLHTVTLGLYTRAARPNPANLATLDVDRRVAHQLNFLDSLLAAGTPPEVACDASRIQASVNELRTLMPFIQSRHVEQRATATLEHLQEVSKNGAIQSDTAVALASFGSGMRPSGSAVPGVAAIVESTK
jgi:hypothetical protein